MSITRSSDSQWSLVEKGTNRDNEVPLAAGLNRLVPRSSPRFGSLSHHSFFSRHNPHPHRVKHIQGLNGRLVCMVKDDGFTSAPLFPHPLIKSQVFRTATGAPFGLPFGASLNRVNNTKNRAALLSEAWREELKELAAKVSLSSQAKKDKKDEQPDETPSRMKTQYSAQTGRIIPPSTRAYQRSRSHQQRPAYPPPLYDQELMVLELLCQILQTDSLSLVQQWLLLSGQREKDLVMGLIQQAMEDIVVSDRQHSSIQALHPHTSLSSQVPSCSQSLRKPRTTSSFQIQQISSVDRPERIGEAEVLEVHTGTRRRPRDEPLNERHNSS